MATISGLYTSSYSLGASLGPLIAGQLVQRFGYRAATLPMVLFTISLTVLFTFYLLKIRSPTKHLYLNLKTYGATKDFGIAKDHSKSSELACGSK